MSDCLPAAWLTTFFAPLTPLRRERRERLIPRHAAGTLKVDQGYPEKKECFKGLKGIAEREKEPGHSFRY